MSVEKQVHVDLKPGLMMTGKTVTIPGDKSVSQRVALLSAISTGENILRNYLRSEDCLNTLQAMTQLGAEAECTERVITVHGRGGLSKPDRPLDFGNSGTGIRLSSGLLAGQDFSCMLTGDDYLCKRPMKRISEPLTQMGATFTLSEPGGTAPFELRGGNLKAIEYRLPMASAQVKSAILLAGLFAEGTTTVIEPAPTRDHTERLFQALGLPVSVNGLEIRLEGLGQEGPAIQGREWDVPGDFSSAAFWVVLAAVQPGYELRLNGVGLNPRRTALLDVLNEMGADIEIQRKVNEGLEPMGDLIVRGKMLKGVLIDGDKIPNLIDEIPILCIAGAMCEGGMEIRDAEELRVKESDRISVMVDNLSAAGVEVMEHSDGMTLAGGGSVESNWTANSQGDHRIAMSMGILSAVSGSPCRIENIACTETSYPGFWSDLEGLGVNISRS